ncbi:rhomboid family intramembrane serine protease [Sphingomonas swuensis]|uniref:Rhomboid family intramembrane serine protease n=1 Tax=Sphingomonas swuensis TaxID=977800 RepID=A0ABP7SYV9_9SPHN
MKLPSTATIWLLIVTAVVSILAGFSDAAIGAMAFVPARVSGLLAIPGAVPAVLTPLSATLIHGGLLHLGFNMLMLAWCGLAVERILGRAGTLTIYAVSAYAAMLAQWLADPQGVAPVIGASGAISGLIGAYALSFGRARRISDNPRTNRWINIVWLAISWAVLQVMVGWVAGQQGLLLATPAHVGGFLAGLLMQRPLLLWRYRKA